MKNYLVLFLSFFLSLQMACKGKETTNQKSTASFENNKYPLIPFDESASFPDASIESVSYENGQFNFGIGGSSYQLGAQTPDAPQKMCANSGDGQHIHLIFDKQPYLAKYEPSFAVAMADGTYNTLAFLSRSYHESIKTDAAHYAKRLTFKGGELTETEDIYEPTLFYSRPKGTYVGSDAERVMLDFYPVNAEIGDDYLVKVQINGEISYLDTWQPYYIEGLPFGDNSIGIALVNKIDSSAVEGRQTSILNKITLKRDPAEVQ